MEPYVVDIHQTESQFIHPINGTHGLISFNNTIDNHHDYAFIDLSTVFTSGEFNVDE